MNIRLYRQAPSSIDIDRRNETTGAPLRPAALLLSLVVIAMGTLLVACALAVLAVLVLVAQIGPQGVSDILLQIQFDLPLRTRLSAATISALYVGLAATTIGAAFVVDRRRWRALVAVALPRAAGSHIMAISLLTLAYGAGATFVMASTKHRVTIDGPTDYLLAGTIIANLSLLAPVAEELFFRGWLYTALRAQFRFVWSFLITAILFVAIHWDPNHRHMLLVLPLAAALGLLRETTGSIRPTVLLHAAYNLLIIAITLAET